MQWIRIEPNKGEIIRYIEDFDYPNKQWLDDPWMLHETLACRISDEYGTVGFVWCHWVEDKTLSAHFGVLPGAAIDWPHLIDKMMDYADFLGADEIALSFDGVKRAKALARLAVSQGFTQDPDNPHGITNFYRRRTHGRNLQPPEAPEASGPYH